MSTLGRAMFFEQRASCWSCGRYFGASVIVGSGGACESCLGHSGITSEQAMAVLPHVWGQKTSRLERATLIVNALARPKR